jgi:hypothetical protein
LCRVDAAGPRTIADLERERKVKVVVKPDPTLHIEQYDIVMI